MIRSQALETAKKIGAPSIKDENYRYTSVRGIEWDLAPMAVPSTDLSSELPAVFSKDPFALLNHAYAPLVRTIRIDRDTTGKGIEIFTPGEHPVHYFQTHVVIEKGVNAWVTDRMTGGYTLLNGLVTFEVKEGAKLSYVQLQNVNRSTPAFIRHHVKIEKAAEVKWIAASCGGAKSQYRLEAELCGSGARMDVKSAVRGSLDQHFDHWMTTTHVKGHTTSSLYHWVVMGDRSRAVMNAKIIIPAEARHSDAVQRNKNLLLSKQATIDSLPRLEIATDEVKCAHGASISPIADDQLYYFQSRGISRSIAESILVDSFTEPALQNIENEEIRNEVRLALIGHVEREEW